MMTFPDDENGDVLRRMQADGFDFTQPHNIEFFAIFPTEEDADELSGDAIAEAFERNLDTWRKVA